MTLALYREKLYPITSICIFSLTVGDPYYPLVAREKIYILETGYIFPYIRVLRVLGLTC